MPVTCSRWVWGLDWGWEAQSFQPLLCLLHHSINADGTLIAFAAGYDWSQEAAHHNPAVNPSQIYVRELTPADLTPAPRR